MIINLTLRLLRQCTPHNDLPKANANHYMLCLLILADSIKGLNAFLKSFI